MAVAPIERPIERTTRSSRFVAVDELLTGIHKAGPAVAGGHMSFR